MTLRAAVIGCGWSGSRFNEGRRRTSIFSHTAAYNSVPGVQLSCIADADGDRLAACQRAWRVPTVYADYREMLRCESPEIVSICTPDETHVEVAKAVLDTPGVRAILCEKPLAGNLRDATAIVRRAERTKVALAVNYSRRYVQGYQRIARLFQREAFGDSLCIHGFYSGGLIHNGTHLLDLLVWFLGFPQVVQSFANAWDRQEAAVDAFLRFPRGVSVVIQGVPARSYPIFELDVLGSDRRLKIGRDGTLIRSYAVRERTRGFDRRLLSQRADTLWVGMQDPTLHAVRDLLAALRQGRAPRCTGWDGVRALAVGEAILRSAATRRPVRLRNIHG